MTYTGKLVLAFLSTSLALTWRDFPTIETVSHHLSSRTLYKNRRAIPGAKSFDEPLPPNSKPYYLYFIARHGTRWPTKKRMRQYSTLESLFEEADPDLQPWIKDWQSPFSNDTDNAGFLHPIGELEMRHMGQRFQKQFPTLLDTYHPHLHKFVSTQVPRASASASAFAQGLFPCEHGLRDPFKISDDAQTCCFPQPTALNMRPKDNDPLLRFFDLNPEFDQYLDHLEPQLSAWETEMWTPLVSKISAKLGLRESKLTKTNIGSLWQLCEQEASLLDNEDCACSLFDNEDVKLMEYVEDAVAFAKKGHLCPEAYTMASTLLQDVLDALSQSHHSGSEEIAKFHFAHAETISPLAAALGLFGADNIIQNKTDNQSCMADWKTALPFDPAKRTWWASSVIPFGANLALLVHSSSSQGPFYVRGFYNEQAISLPPCPTTLDCPLDTFLAESSRCSSTYQLAPELTSIDGFWIGDNVVGALMINK